MKKQSKIKKLLVAAAGVMCAVTMLTSFAGCTAKEKEILVIAREDGSGTRDGFDGLIKSADGKKSLAKDENGAAWNPLLASVEKYNSTGAVSTKVANTKSAIGYISLGSLGSNANIKGVKINGIEPTAENVLNNTYALQRPFVIMTGKQELTSAAADFYAYLQSTQAQKIVEDNGYVKQADGKTAYTAPTTAISGKVYIKGSTSVEPLMKKLMADYQSIGGTNVVNVDLDMDAQGSGQGLSAAKSDSNGNVIGMSSSAIKAADAPSLNYYSIALDGIAVIVNKNNEITNLTTANLYDIYTGAIKKFSEIK